jgi:4-diphosphocytidyl-2-C-methyl-D-erythritol kinase
VSEPGAAARPPAGAPAVHEQAYAKVNLVLHIGRPRPDGLHPLCSIFASLDLADDVYVRPAGGGTDDVRCPGVDGPNLAAAAIAAFRDRCPSLPALEVDITKRIPVAAGLGGGSADAAAVLRAANRIAGEPFDPEGIREIAATLGSDVPSQVDPGHALVTGVGEGVDPIQLPELAVVLAPQAEGLRTPAVYEELDRMGGWREHLDPGAVRAIAEADPSTWTLENDLQPAALSLRPELAAVLDELRAAGALATLVSGSGPTCFGLYGDLAAARTAAEAVPGALAVRLRAP